MRLVREDKRWGVIPRSKLGWQIHNANEDVVRKPLLEKKMYPLTALHDYLNFHHESNLLTIHLTRIYFLNTTPKLYGYKYKCYTFFLIYFSFGSFQIRLFSGRGNIESHNQMLTLYYGLHLPFLPHS